MMKRKVWFGVGLLTMTLLAGCGAKVDEEVTDTPQVVAEPVSTQKEAEPAKELKENKDMIQSYEPVQNFSYELFIENMEEDNPVLSPVSAYLALALAGAGAEGETLSEFQTVMGDLEGIPGDLMNNLPREVEGIKITLANSAWLDDELMPNADWISRADSVYKSEVFQTELASQETMQDMNQWVSARTEGLIPTLLSEPMDIEARLALFNTIYFKGEWRSKFLEKDTKERVFTLADKTTEMVDMMEQTNEKLLYVKNDVSEGVILPYKDDSMALVTLKPVGDITVREMYEQLTRGDMHTFLQQEEKTLCNLRLPKFKVEFSKTLNDSLQAMGLEKAFQAGAADFDGLGTTDTGENLFINLVFQKAVVIVDEEGTEAAAVTAVMMETVSCGVNSEAAVDIYFDEPFLYMIVDREREIPLFIGIMDNPAF